MLTYEHTMSASFCMGLLHFEFTWIALTSRSSFELLTQLWVYFICPSSMPALQIKNKNRNIIRVLIHIKKISRLKHRLSSMQFTEDEKNMRCENNERFNLTSEDELLKFFVILHSTGSNKGWASHMHYAYNKNVTNQIKHMYIPSENNVGIQ